MTGNVHLVEERAEPSEPDELEVTLKPLSGPSTQEEAIVVLSVEGDDRPTTKVEVSGSIADVIKRLEKRIAGLKEEESTDATKEQIKALEKALETLKSHGGTVLEGKKGSADSDKGKRITERRIIIGRLPKPQDEQISEVIRLRQEISNHRVTLKETLKKIHEAQAKIRELGGDPGETPDLTWHHADQGTRVERRYVVTRPRYVVTRPVKPEAPATDHQRLEQLEKRLKDIQQELHRMKKEPTKDARTKDH